MRVYELILVLRPSLKEADRKKLTAGIKGLLKDLKITKEEEKGDMDLSYKIKQEKKGFFMELILEGEAVIPSDFEKKLFEDENVLRHLLLRRK